MNHVMIDLETLGTNPKAPIASIGAVFFDPKTGELGEQFYCRVDFENHMKNEAVPDGAIIKWWLRQSAEARAELISDDACRIGKTVGDFSDWLTDNADDLRYLKVWANSPSLDCTILKSAFVVTHTDIPWNYWNERDVRTIKELSLMVTGFDQTAETSGVKHKALDDAVAQASMVSTVISRLVPEKPETIWSGAWIDWNEISKRGLMFRINKEIMHPLGLAVFRDPITGVSPGALISDDGKWEYDKNLYKPLCDLLFSEVADFFAGLGQPGEPQSPTEMQRVLLSRLEQVINARAPK